MADTSPCLHRVTIEFLNDSLLEIHDFDCNEEAQRCIDSAMKNPAVWHIFCQIEQEPTGHLPVVFSIYRSNETRQWPLRHRLLFAE